MGMLLSAMVAASPAVAREPTKPIPRQAPASWFKEEDYPTAERFKGISGTTTFNLLVGDDGSVRDCSIATSSGSAALDATACALLKARASFVPARDGNGRKIESIYNGRVTWRLPAGSPTNLPAPQGFTVSVDMNKNGVVEKCTVEKTADFSLPADPCMRYPVGMKGPSYIDKDGKPIAVRLLNHMSMEVQPR